MAGRRNSNTQLLDELEELTHSLYQSHTSTNRRTASLALPRNAVPPIPSIDEADAAADDQDKFNPKPRSRRMSLSPWRSRPKPELEIDHKLQSKASNKKQLKNIDDKTAVEKKGLWNWKPIRALTHIGMHKLSCLFSIEVVTVQGLPASMNGLRLSVCVRKKETKDGTVQTMPSRVSQGAADFEETLFVRCHVYCSSAETKFEPRPFFIYVLAIDAKELDFGKTCVDLSDLIQESVDKNFDGERVRQWDTTFNLTGKAKGGELVLKLGFQIMEKDGGSGIYNQGTAGQKSTRAGTFSPSFGRRQSKSSFSIPSPRLTSRAEAWTPSQAGASTEFQEIDDLNLDEPALTHSPSAVQNFQDPESKMDDLDLPDFEVVDKGVEVQGKEWTDGQSEENSDKRSVSSEVVKEVVHDQVHQARLTELELIAQQIKALESMMEDEKSVKNDEETASQQLDADEETVTKDFLQSLEDDEANENETYHFEFQQEKQNRADDNEEADSMVYLPDLGKGLGCVVQTRNGGYLAAVNPLDTLVAKKETPKLAMQISKQMVLRTDQSITGFEIIQSMAATGTEKLSSEILSLMPLDELLGKTAEQIAFEGIASAIISGRNKEGASSTAARTIAAVKSMATGMSTGRKERISTGIWNVNENPVTVDDILGFSMQKIESMAVEALKIQAEIAEEEAPFDVSPLNENGNLLASTVPLEDWIKESSVATSNHENEDSETIIILVVVQMRDPMRQYEAVGAPLLSLIYATQVNGKTDGYEEEKRFKVDSMHIGCLKIRNGGGKKNVWDSEKQRLTSMQWLVAYGLGKAAKKGKRVISKGQDLFWSISSRVMADMWLKPLRNPDVMLQSH
ncbi:protein PLASTID MOVEMENT IMPAIRED 1 [Apium graveolens]|uniref:protein PLASTID MOVEMENT IMPAIRED 1 n=1 Tax=Apium graveolens TaxID=4045 RepID=UPI003D78F113